MTLTLFTVKVIDRKESEKRQNVKDEDRKKWEVTLRKTQNEWLNVCDKNYKTVLATQKKSVEKMDENV